MDRLTVQVQFKKFIWTCPKCGQEDVEDANVGGGNTYEHDCSNVACRAHYNQSGPNLKEYNGCLNYSQEEFEKKDDKDVVAEKNELCSKWIGEIKNPAPVIAPTVEDFQRMISDKMKDIERDTEELAKIATVEEMSVLISKMDVQKVFVEAKAVEVSAKIAEAEILEKPLDEPILGVRK